MADSFRRSSVKVLGNELVLLESKHTGLRGIVIATGEPLCNLHVVVATEADTNEWSHKDDGLPHTLEHAIFMGSERYPFKGILDKAANRSLADGTPSLRHATAAPASPSTGSALRAVVSI